LVGDIYVSTIQIRFLYYDTIISLFYSLKDIFVLYPEMVNGPEIPEI